MKNARLHIDIKKFLPHREPMLMVNTMPYLDADSVVTEFHITEDCIFVDKGRLSETGLIENAAQACSAIVGQSYFETDDLEGKGNKVIGYISAIKKVEIFQLPTVNETLITKAKLISRYDTEELSICTITGSIFRKDDLIVDCTLNFLIHEVQ
ncbi:ABC transporter permease [Ulvibacterium marinum]|uniref:ABC transporter permease n=1 Tax=Ulvibacterium marinum TaxID=2419782 RepID=A0A3B0C9R0_9FLAO|nr:ABC transporter permease [Ulvibacterium marinum]RKN82393.1 ABC transporter permease [Ulvibacterium marinum]